MMQNKIDDVFSSTELVNSKLDIQGTGFVPE